MITSINSMIDKLSPLGIYNLSNDTLVYKELIMYSVALDEISSLLEELERECFVQTAVSYGLSNREKIWGFERDDLSVEKRKSIILNRLNIDENNFTLEAMENFLSVVNFNADIEENPTENQVLINNKNTSYSKAERAWIKEQLVNFFPAHLELIVDFRVITWEDIDNKNLTFAQMDSASLTWKDIENYGV